ncbi:hypothetical protein HK101_011987 [Irineochytrium annulatum]|nr:hypothetical protein HK101_011987 [Irineochytrium annulatum]
MPKVSRTKKSRVHHPAVPAPGAKRTDMRFAGLADTSSHDQAEGKEAATTKRDKREERREGWLNKLNVHYAVKYRADLKRKKVEKEGVAADLDSLKFALLEEELKGGEQDGEGDAGEEMEKEEGNEPSAVDNLKPVEKKPVSQRARIKGK